MDASVELDLRSKCRGRNYSNPWVVTAFLYAAMSIWKLNQEVGPYRIVKREATDTIVIHHLG